MAQNLNSYDVNLFEVGDGLDVIGVSAPTGVQDIGISRQFGEAGFYLNTDDVVQIWFKYDDNAGNIQWQLYMELDPTDEHFNDGDIPGAMIPWSNHETFGSVHNVYFVTNNSTHRVRLQVITDNVHVDYQPGNNDFEEQFVSFDGDTSVVGGLTSDVGGYVRVDHDLTGYEPGDSYTTTIQIGEVDSVVSMMDRFKNLYSIYEYDPQTGNCTIDFIVPEIKNNKSRFHSYVSLGGVNMATTGIFPPVHNGMTLTVKVGDTLYGDGTLRYRLPMTGTFVIDWGDGTPPEQYTGTSARIHHPIHTYASAGQYDIKIANATGITFTHHYGTERTLFHTNAVGHTVNNSPRRYIEDDDVANVGPIEKNDSFEILTGTNVSGVSVSATGSTLTIVDTSGKDWSGYFDGSRFNSLSTVTRQVGQVSLRIGNTNKDEQFAPVQSVLFDGSNTTTVTLAYGKPMGHTRCIENEIGYSNSRNWLQMRGGMRVYYGPADINQTLSNSVWQGNSWDLDRNIPYYVEPNKIIDIKQWGNISYISVKGLMEKAHNLDISATDSPDFSGLANLSYLFIGCSSLTDPNKTLEAENVIPSSATKIDYAFHSCTIWSPTDLSKWDVSNVKDFTMLFYQCYDFNPIGIHLWELKEKVPGSPGVITMTSMFEMCFSFNRDLKTSYVNGTLRWSTLNVKDMGKMFKGCYLFNGDISNWDVSRVQNFTQFLDCWHGAGDQSHPNYSITGGVYNQPMQTVSNTVSGYTGAAWAAWKTTLCLNMGYMFRNQRLFNQDISNWDVSLTTQFFSMFRNCFAYNQPMNTKHVTSVAGYSYLGWRTQSARSFAYMFTGARSFNQPISNWQTDNVVEGANLTNTQKGHAQLSAFSSMFNGAWSYNQPMVSQSVTIASDTWDAWNMENAASAISMFRYAVSFNQDLSSWNVSSLEWASTMFEKAINFNQDLSTWGTNGDGTMSLRHTGGMFSDMRDMTYGNSFSTWNFDSVFNAMEMFRLVYVRSSNGYDTFREGGDIYDFLGGVNISPPGATTVIDSNANLIAYYSAYDTLNNLTTNTSNTVDHYPFVPDVSNWSVSSLSNGSYMFSRAHPDFDLDLSAWQTDNLYTARAMFYASRGFGGIGLGSWNTMNLSLTGQMFNGSGFEEDISNWNVESLTEAHAMFGSTPKLLGTNFTNWKPFNLQIASEMFQYSGITDGFENWTTGSIETAYSMFKGANNFNCDLIAGSQYTDSDGNVHVVWDLHNVARFDAFIVGNSFNGDVSNWELTSMVWGPSLIQSSVFEGNGVESWNMSLVRGFGTSTGLGLFPYNNITAAKYSQILTNWATIINSTGSLVGDFTTTHPDSLGGNNKWVQGDPIKEKTLSQVWLDETVYQYIKTVSFGNAQYTAAAAAKKTILENAGWVFIDGGQL